MGSYADYKKRKAQAAKTAEATAPQKKTSYQQYKERKRAANSGYSVDTNYQSLMADYKAFATAAQTDSANVGYGNARGYLEGRSGTAKELRDRANKLALYLHSNQDVLDTKAYETAISDIESVEREIDRIMDYFGDKTRYFSQWDTEDEYNAFIAEQKAYEDQLNLDTETAAREIAQLESYLKDYDYLTRWQQDEAGQQREAAYRAKYGDVADLKALIQQKREYLDQAKKVQEFATESKAYTSLMDAENFAEMSKYVPQKRKEQRPIDAVMGNYSNEASGWDDPLYEYINGNQDAGAYISNQAAENYGGEGLAAIFGRASESKTESQRMTKDEVAIFNYIYATQGKDAAHAYYYDHLQSELNARQREYDTQYWANYAKEDPFGSSVFSVVTSPLKGLTYAGQAADYIAGGKIDQNAGYNKFSYTNSAIRNQVSQQIVNSGKWGKVGSLLYQTGMSLGDFVLNTAITGGNQTLALAIMGSGSAADMTISAKDKGLSDNQAFALGTIAGAAEILMEKISLDALFNADLLANGSLKYVLKNALAEGGEEIGTDLINTLADVLIARDKSDWQMAIDAYMAEGKSESEAFGLALGDKALELGLSGLGGVLSGGVMSGVGAVVNHAQKNAQAQQLYGASQQELVTKALENAPDNAFAQKMQSKLEGGKSLSGSQLNKLVQQNEAAIKKQGTAVENVAVPDTTETQQIATEMRAEATPKTSVSVSSQVQSHASEGVYEASEDGKTHFKDEPVNIVGVASVKDSSMKLKLEDGRVVDAKEVQYSSADEAVVYETVAGLGVHALGANMLIENYTPGGNVTAKVYAKGIEEAYMAGSINLPQAALSNTAFASQLTMHQQWAAYNLGKLFGGKKQSDTKQAEAESKKTTSNKVRAVRKRGIVKSRSISTQDWNRVFNSAQKDAYSILDRIAHVTGIDIILYQSKPDAKGNLRGGIVDGIDMSGSQGGFSWHNDKIYIDINAGVLSASEMGDVARYSMLRTFTHEFTHFIEKHNAEHWGILRDAVFSTMRRNGVDPDLLINEYMDNHKGTNRDAASREVVAEAMVDVLPQSNFVEELVLKHRNVFETLVDKLKEFVEQIRAHFKTLGTSRSKEPAAVKEYVDGVMKYADDLVELFDKIAVQAVENYQAERMAQKNTAPESGVQMQARPSAKDTSVLDPKTVTKADVAEMLENVKSHKYADNTYIPVRISTPGIVQERLFAKDLPIIMPVSKVSQAFSHDNGPVKGKNVRGHGLSVGQLIEIVERMDSPDFVYSQDNGRGVEVIRLGGTSDNTVVIVEFDNNVNPAYMNGYEGGTYNVSVTTFNVDGGNVGLFMYSQEKGWHEVFNKQKEGDPAKKFPATRPFAIEQGSLNDNVPQQRPAVNNNSSGEQHQDRTGTITNRDIIAESVGKTKLEQEKIAEYQKLVEQSREQSRIMAERQKELDELEAAGESTSGRKYLDVLREKNKAKNRRNNYEGQLRRMENGVLEPLINREKGRVLDKLRNTYGTIPKGEKAVRDDSLPVSTDGVNKVSRTARTVKGAGVTPDEFADMIDTEVVKGGLSYIPITNDEATQRAMKYIAEEGWEAAKEGWSKDVRAGKVSAELTAIGALLLNNAAKAGNRTVWMDILHDYQHMGTNAGQATQALRILKQLQPEDKLYMIRRSIKQMVEDMRLGYDIEIDPELEKSYRGAKTEEEANRYLEDIEQSVADQIPSTWMDKWTALRYVNMLGNLRTQVRNLAGNLGMKAVVSLKDGIAVGLEQIAHKVSGGKFHRTKSLVISRELLDAAKADFKMVETAVQGGGKYSDSSITSTEFARAVRDKQRIFGVQESEQHPKLSKAANLALAPLEGYRKATNWAMDKGDAIFSKSAYARALAGYLQANGVKDGNLNNVNPLLLDRARAYAIQEAQETTFWDTNVLSGWLTTLGRKRTTPAFAKVLSEGIMPFRKTPANVLIRAEEYSPLGVVNSLYTSIRAMQKNSDVTGAQVINSWSKTLTGTGLFALGMLLHNLGLLIGGPDDDESLDKFEDLNGQQNYALKIGDVYITIDWLSPAAIPMFIGAQIHKMMQDGGIEAKEIESALTSIMDPLIQMSMLQGVNGTLEDIRYAESNLGQMLINAAASYLTQGLTNTLIGQIERGFEDSRMSTYADKNSALPNWMQQQIGRASAKTPGLDYNQIPYVNAWGEEEQNPITVLNLIYNMLSPSYISKGEQDAVSQELTRLHEVNEAERSVLPSTPKKTIDSFTDSSGVKHKDYNLSADEYVALAKAQGQTQRQIVESMVASELYEGLPDKYKVKAVHFAYDYARESAQTQVINRDGFSSKWMAEIEGDTAEGILNHVIAENIEQMYLERHITADEAIKRRMEYHGDTADEAAGKVACWDFKAQKADIHVDDAWFKTYYKKVESSGIDLDAYVTYRNEKAGLTKRDEVLEIIDAQPISDDQKDALYFAEGYAKSTLNEAPWH